MRQNSFPGLMSVVVLLLLLTGCAREPYIFEEAEFDRTHPDFAKERTDRQVLQICYAKQTTTPQDLLAMANAECGRFGKEAIFVGQDTLVCPILTPARATFTCGAP